MVRAGGQPDLMTSIGELGSFHLIIPPPLKYAFLPLHGQSQTQAFMFQITGWRRGSKFKQVIPFKQVKQKLPRNISHDLLLRAYLMTAPWTSPNLPSNHTRHYPLGKYSAFPYSQGCLFSFFIVWCPWRAWPFSLIGFESVKIMETMEAESTR